MSEHSDDINDIFFGLRPEAQEIASISNDSNLGSSLSNFGIDRANEEENQRYIQINQNPEAIVQGIGVAARVPDAIVSAESGQGTSISKTASSAFSPIIIEFQDDVLDKDSEVNAAVEVELDVPSQQFEISSFDLALRKGYHDQAKLYLDDASSKGLPIQTNHVRALRDVASDEQQEKIIAERGPSALEEPVWTFDYIHQINFNIRKKYEEYLEDLENKEYEKLLKKLDSEKPLTKTDEQLKKNIETEENRNNLELQRETIEMIQNSVDLAYGFKPFFEDCWNNYIKEVIETGGIGCTPEIGKNIFFVNNEEQVRGQLNGELQKTVEDDEVASGNSDHTKDNDNGLAASADNNSDATIKDEPQPGPSSGKRTGYDPKYEESEILANSLQKLDISSKIETALKQGNYHEAEMCFNYAESMGLEPQSNYIKTFNEFELSEDEKSKLTAEWKGGVDGDDIFWSGDYTLLRIFSLKSNFVGYLDCLKRKEYKKVLEKLNNKNILNEIEKQIKKNIGTEANRNNIKLQNETLTITREFIAKLEQIFAFVKDNMPSSKKEQDEKNLSKH